jgi:hypothetical protein
MIRIAVRRLRERIVVPTRPQIITLPLPVYSHRLGRWGFFQLDRSPDGRLWMANMVMNEAKESIFDRNIDLIVDTLKAGLATATYVPNADEQFIDEGGADDFVDGRAAGTTDQTLGGKVIGKDLTGDFTYLDANDSVFSAVPAGPAVTNVTAYKDTGVATTSKILCVYDITDITPNGGDITIQWATPANGGVLKGA